MIVSYSPCIEKVLTVEVRSRLSTYLFQSGGDGSLSGSYPEDRWFESNLWVQWRVYFQVMNSLSIRQTWQTTNLFLISAETISRLSGQMGRYIMLADYLPCKEKVTGAAPVRSTICMMLASFYIRTCHTGERGVLVRNRDTYCERLINRLL